jgi:hypothetical protein
MEEVKFACDSLLEGAGFEPSVPRGCARRVACRFSCASTFSVGGELSRGDIQRLVVSRGTDGSNPSPSSKESVASLTLESASHPLPAGLPRGAVCHHVGRMAMRTASGSTSPIEGSSCRARLARSRASGIDGRPASLNSSS